MVINSLRGWSVSTGNLKSDWQTLPTHPHHHPHPQSTHTLKLLPVFTNEMYFACSYLTMYMIQKLIPCQKTISLRQSCFVWMKIFLSKLMPYATLAFQYIYTFIWLSFYCLFKNSQGHWAASSKKVLSKMCKMGRFRSSCACKKYRLGLYSPFRAFCSFQWFR